MSDQIHYTLDQHTDPGKAPPFFQLHVRPSFSPLDINIAFLGRTGWQQSTDRIRFHTESNTPKASTHPLADVLHTFKPHLLIRRLDQPEDHFASIHISQWKNISQIAH